MTEVRFSKMHDLGNDFVVFNGLQHDWRPSPAWIRAYSDRHRGIGFDQWLMIDAPRDETADYSYAIYNANGELSGQCLNGSRCVAYYLEKNGLCAKPSVRLQSTHSTICVKKNAPGTYCSTLAGFHADPQSLRVEGAGSHNPYTLYAENGTPLHFYGVFLGNPHAVIMVDNLNDTTSLEMAQALYHHPAFAEGINVERVQAIAEDRIAVHILERGVGPTMASGSGAAASAIATMMHHNRFGTIDVEMPGGTLSVQACDPQGPVQVVGNACHVFDGCIAPSQFTT